MCMAPIIIDNPFYGLGEDISTKVGKLRLSRSLNWLKNTHDSKIQVPCGQCQQCVSMRQGFVNQRIQMESLRSHLYYFTLTYNNRSLVRTDVGQYKVAYPFYEDISRMFKRLRAKGYKFRYWVVSEYGTSEEHTHRPHYHGILAVPIEDYKNKFEYRIKEQFWSRELLKEWRRNYGSSRVPKYDNLCDYKVAYRYGRRNSTYDFHYIEPVLNHDNDVSFYVSKYILSYDDRVRRLLYKIKMDPNIDDDNRSLLLHQIKPRSVMSKDFGDYNYPKIKEYINDCLSKNDKIPQFFDLYTGQPCLLAPYYRKHLGSIEWYINRFMLYSQSDTSYLVDDDMELRDYNDQVESNVRKMQKFSSIKDKLRKKFL